MITPLEVEIDRAVGAGYVCYKRLPSERTVARTERVSEDVAVDFDESGAILGLELIDLEDTSIETARSYAEARGYAFPTTEELGRLAS